MYYLLFFLGMFLPCASISTVLYYWLFGHPIDNRDYLPILFLSMCYDVSITATLYALIQLTN